MKMRFLCLAALMMAVMASAANAAFVNSYDFDTDLSDTLGNGNDLTSSGGTVSGGRYSFSENEGLELTSALLDTSNYGIEMKLRSDDSVSGWNKLIDFEQLSSDSGLYVFEGDLFFWYLPSANSPMISIGTDFIVGLERKAGIISVFLDGALRYTAIDTLGEAVSSSNILNFLVDDTAITGEAFAGSVDWIRIHEDSSTFGQAPSAVPEPASLAMWGLGAIGMMFARRKRQQTN